MRTNMVLVVILSWIVVFLVFAGIFAVHDVMEPIAQEVLR